MTSDRHTQIARLFERVVDLDPDEQRRALEEVRVTDPAGVEHVERLLAADRSADEFERPAALHLTGVVEPPRRKAELPESIGPYRITGLLGEGGMGIVYEAEQDVPRRSVALKLIRPGLVTEDRLRRFQHEAEVLARLDHPGVATIFAAGTAETEAGRQPYIAMERVEGERIDRYAESAELDPRARVELVRQLCEAVHHAHTKGVVHRDLKPANVIVTPAGRVKVLDFGVARVTDSDARYATLSTDVGEVLGTLPYMSPEQVAADPARVDTRSDVYAVGVMAYQLLSGHLPLDVTRRSLAEAARIIAEEEPSTLGSRDARLRGDLEWIVAKALAKEKDERYASAHELASDLQRHLNDEPILAGPPSRLQALRKFARRNRGLVAGLAAAFVALVIALAVSLTLLARTSEALRERDEEVVAAGEAISFLEDVFAQSDPFAGHDIKLSEFAERAARRFEGELIGRPVLRARLLNSIGKTFLDLERAKDARPLLEEALEIRANELGEETVEYAQTLERVARVEQLDGNFEAAEEMQRRVIELRERWLGPSILLSDAHNNLAVTLSLVGRTDEALEESARAAEIAAAAPDVTWDDIAAKRTGLAGIHEMAGRFPEAERILREVLSDERELAEHLEIQARFALARALRYQRRTAEALETIQGVRSSMVARYGDELSYLSQIDAQEAMILTELGRTTEAVELLTARVERVTGADGPRSLSAAQALHDLAYVQHDLPVPECEVALSSYRRSEEIFVELFGDRGLGPQMARHNRAMLLERLGRYDEAETLMRTAYGTRREVLGESDPNTLASQRGLAGIRFSQSAYEEAAQLYTEFVAAMAELMGPASIPVQTARLQLAAALTDDGRLDEARAVVDEAERLRADMHDPAAFENRVRRARERIRAAE